MFIRLLIAVVLIWLAINLAFAEIVVINNPDSGTLTQCIVNQGVVTCF